MKELRIFVGALFFICCQIVTESAERPNIVFILGDDVGWNDVGFQGSDQIPTPNLDALAYDGVLLSNYYVQPLCTPTRAALLTGKYPIRTGLQHYVILSSEPYGLGLNETLMSQYLKQLGYATHIVGKWHLGFFAKEYTPTKRGFDSHFGHYQAFGDYYDHTHKIGDDNKTWGLDLHDDMDIVRDEFGQYSTEIFTSRAERIIRNHNTSQPLYLYLPHQAVHSGNPFTPTPLEAPWRYQERVSHIQHPGRRTVAAMISALDESVGNVTKALHERGMLENTIIVFSTDNGGPAAGHDMNYCNNWPLRGMKSTVWEGGMRGNGFVWSPLLKKSGITSSAMMHVVDWLPTLLTAAGYTGSLPADLDGIDMWQVLQQGLHTSPRTQILHNIDPIEGSWAVRDGDMKLMSAKQLTTTYNFDNWYKPESYDFTKQNYNGSTKKNSQIRSNADEFGQTKRKTTTYQSTVELVLKKMGRPNRPPHPTIINCGLRPQNSSNKCHLNTEPCLYNITADPCEYNNLAHSEPLIADRLYKLYESYEKIMVKPLNKPSDPKGLPYYNHGVWEPWVDLTEN